MAKSKGKCKILTKSKSRSKCPAPTTTNHHLINDPAQDLSKEKVLVARLVGNGAARDALSYKSKRPQEKVLEGDELAQVKSFLEKKDETMHEMVGLGAFAEVYRGVNHKVKKNVAIKVINLKKASDHYREKLLPQEIAVVKVLKHDRIIKIFQISQVGYMVVMVMEYAAKGTMSNLICKVGALSEPTAWLMFSQVFSGLAYMHSKSIAHRDLKLDNLLINHKNVPKLADFSFSVHFDRVTLCTDFCGSIPYFSPELLSTKPYNPLLSDIWSLAVSLYIMTNDNFPFRFVDDKAMLEAQLAKNWHFRARTERDFSDSYQELMHLMLEPDVNSRINTVNLSKHPWLITEQKEIAHE